MDAKQLKCIEYMVLYPDMTQKEIAKEINITEKTICEWKKSPLFQQELKNKVDDMWHDMLYKAQRRMYELMDSPNDSVALGASKYVMDGLGRAATQKLEVRADKLIGLEDDNS